MLPPAAAVATVVVARFLWILIVVGAGLLLASVFGLVSAAPRFRRVAFVTAFVVCGLVTLLFGGGFYYFWYGWGHQVVDFQLSLALTTVGILALAVAVAPDAWLGGDKAEQRRQFGLGSARPVPDSDLYLDCCFLVPIPIHCKASWIWCSGCVPHVFPLGCGALRRWRFPLRFSTASSSPPSAV